MDSNAILFFKTIQKKKKENLYVEHIKSYNKAQGQQKVKSISQEEGIRSYTLSLIHLPQLTIQKTIKDEYWGSLHKEHEADLSCPHE